VLGREEPQLVGREIHQQPAHLKVIMAAATVDLPLVRFPLVAVVAQAQQAVTLHLTLWVEMVEMVVHPQLQELL
jgi:hypothetical protein